jgi:hypothetical protein
MYIEQLEVNGCGNRMYQIHLNKKSSPMTTLELFRKYF